MAARRALAAVGRPGGTVEVAVVDDAEIRRLNARYRGIARRTDVLAFPLETPDAPGQLVGQIVISAETARATGPPAAACRWRSSSTCSSRTVRCISWATTTATRVEADLMHRRERDILRDAPARLWRGLLHR